MIFLNCLIDIFVYIIHKKVVVFEFRWENNLSYSTETLTGSDVRMK